MLKLILIAVGGGLGSVMRYLVAGWMQALVAPRLFPYGTLTVNVAGCLLIGFLMPVIDWKLAPEARFLLVVGVLGGFTTFSAFGWETLAFVNDGQWLRVGANVLLNNAMGLTAAWIGFRAAHVCFNA